MKTRIENGNDWLELKLRGRVWQAYGYVGGRLVRTSLKTTSRIEASERQLRLLRGDPIEGVAPAKGGARITFGEIVDEYLRRPEGVAPSSVRRLTRLKKVFGHREVRDITSDDVRAYVREYHDGQSAASIARMLVHVKAILNWGRKHGLIPESVAIPRIAIPSVGEADFRLLSHEEVAALIETARTNDDLRYLWPIVSFMYYTGARTGEAMLLEWSQITRNWNAVRLWTIKGASRTRRWRVVPLREEVREALEWAAKTWGRSGRVFRDASGKPWVHSNAGGKLIGFSELAQRAGVKNVRPYDLRHAFASHLRMAGTALEDLTDLMGHKRIEQTRRYAHLFEGDYVGIVSRLPSMHRSSKTVCASEQER